MKREANSAATTATSQMCAMAHRSQASCRSRVRHRVSNERVLS